MLTNRDHFRHARRVVIKVGSSSLTHSKTGKLDLNKMEVLVRELCDLHNAGMDVVLVSSGAIMVGCQTLNLDRRPKVTSRVQACASVGQARLMLLYQKLFTEYNQICSQILLTKHTMVHDTDRRNARNTFEELFDMGVIPIVNENDTISTDEIEFGDNDTLSAVVASLVKADLLVLLSDIDGLYTDDPNINPDAEFISEVDDLTDNILMLGKDSSSKVGTGGMSTKLHAARLAISQGTGLIIANAKDFHIINRIMDGQEEGTFFLPQPDPVFSIMTFLTSQEAK